MTVYCVVCGKPIERRKPSRKNFCSIEHRNLWMSENVDFVKLAHMHKAAHLQTGAKPIRGKPALQQRRISGGRSKKAKSYTT